MAETETEEDIDWSQFSKEPPIDWSQYSNVRPTPKLEAPPGVLSDAEMGPEQIDRSGILSGPQAGVAAIGKGLHAAGKLARNVLGAYAFEAVGEPELQAQQLGAAAKGVGVETPPWMQPEGEEPPLEEGMKRLPTPLRIAAEVPYGLAQSAPQIAGVIGAQAAGVPAPLAAAAVFGTTEEGFDPKQAAVAAALPFIGRLGGEIAGAFAKKVGVSTAEAVNLIKKAGGLGSVAGYLGIMDLSAIMALPPEQRKEAAVNAFSSQLAMLMFGPQGVRTEGPRIARPGVATVEVGGRATPVPEVPPTLEAGRGEISTRPEPKLLTEGEPNARSVEETAAVHGDLRPPTGEGEGQVPVPQGRGGVQPLESRPEERQAQGALSLGEEQTHESGAKFVMVQRKSGTGERRQWVQTTRGKRSGDVYDEGDAVKVVAIKDASTEGMPSEYTVKTYGDILAPDEVDLRKRDMTPAEIEAKRQKISRDNEQRREMGFPEEPIPEVPKAKAETKSLTPSDVSKMTPEEYFEDAAAKSKATMEGKGDGLSVQTRAEQAALANPDIAEWTRMRDEAAAEAQKIRDEVKANPKTMQARQKEMMGAGQKVQFFNEGLKVLEGKKAPEPVEKFPNSGVGSPADEHGAVYGPTLNREQMTRFGEQSGESYQLESPEGTETNLKVKPTTLWLTVTKHVKGLYHDQAVAYLKIRPDGTTVIDASKHGRPIDKLAADQLINFLKKSSERDVKTESDRLAAKAEPSPAAPAEIGKGTKTPQPAKQKLRGALERIRDNPNSDHSTMAGRLLKLGDEAGLNVNVESQPGFRSQYSPTRDDIRLHPERLNDDQTVMHEAVHALTNKKLSQEITGTYGIPNLHEAALDNYLETGPNANVKELIKIYKEAKKHPEAGQHHGTTDFQEYMSESMSNGTFQKFLSGIKLSGKKTLWQRFVSAVRKLLGLSPKDESALGKTIEHIEELVKSPRPEPTEAVATKPEPPPVDRPKTAQELGVPGIKLPRFGPTGREGGNEAGFIDLGPVYDWLTTIGPKTRYVIQRTLRNLGYTRESARRFFKGGKVREAMGVLRGAGENESNIFGRQMGNEIRQPMTRERWTYNPPGKLKQLAKKAAAKRIAEDALSFVVEARRNLTKLQEFRDKITNSAIANPYWKNRALEAIDFARANWAKLDPHAARYKEITDAQLDTENRNGVDTLRREGYVPHHQDIVDPWEAFKAGGNGGGGMFRKTREHETFADSIAAGVNPKSLNAVDLLESRVQAGTRIVNYRVWIQGLRNATDPITGHPIVADPVVQRRADGSTYQEAPPGYSLEHVRNQPVAIHNGFEGMFTALNDPSVFARSMAGRGLMKAAQGGKSMALVFDTFHLGRVAFWNGLLRAAGIKSAQFPAFWKYGRGKTLVDFTIPQIQQMVARGEVPAKWGRQLVQDKQILNHLLAQGYNLGRISDSMHQEWVRAIPGIGHFNKFLFEKFQRGAMSEIGLLEFKRLKAARPSMPDAAIARYVSKALNKRFGNLGFDSIIKRKSFQDVARVLALAPQWNEGLIRSELGAVKELAQFGVDAVQGKKIYAGILMRSTIGMMLGYLLVNQIINQYTRGKFTWENPEEGIGAKLSAWVPDFIGGGPGFFLNPMSLAAETTHLLLDKYEKTEDFRKALMQYARSRSGTLTKPLMTFITNEDFLGRRIKPGGIWAAMAKEAVPVPIAAPALAGAVAQKVSGEPREAYPGQFQKQGMASLGVRTEGTPSPGTRIARLANKFNVEHGVMRFEFAPSDYADLRAALVVGNKTEARAQIEQLLKKNTPAAIERALKSSATRNFTQSNALEKQFRATLNQEQRKAYEQAIQDRLKVARSGIELLQEVWKESQKPKQ